MAVVAVPLSLCLLALAPLGAAGTRPGLMAAFVTAALGGLLYAALGRAVLPAAGPSSATTLILAGLVLQLAADPTVLDGSPAGVLRVLAGASAAVALSGLLQIVMARAGLARLARLVPRPVLGGFMNGVALLILIGQLPLLAGQLPGAPLHTLFAGLQPAALALGLGTAAGILLLERLRARLPSVLLALVAGTVVHGLLQGGQPPGAVGPAVGAVPPLSLEEPALALVLRALEADALLPHALAIATTALVLALIGGLETVLGLLALDEQLGARHDPQRELQAMGLCNLVCGALGGLPVVVLRARAVAIVQAGGRSRTAAAVGSLALALLFLAGTPLLARLPLPVLGGVMVVIAIGLVDRWAGTLLARWWRGDASADLRSALAVMTAVCVATVALGFAAGVALGVPLSMLIFIVRMNRSLLRSDCSALERPSRRWYPASIEARLRPLRPQVRIWELEGALFFGNADRLLTHVDTLPGAVRALVLDLRHVNSIDETGASALLRLGQVLKRRRVLLLATGIPEGSPCDRALRSFHVELPRQPDIDRATEMAEHHLLGDAAEGTLVGVPLQGCELLRGLDAGQRSSAAALMPMRRLAPGEVLFRQGDPADGLFVVVQGSVSLIGSDGRVSQRYLSVSPGMMLGEAAMLDGGGRSADAVADTAVVLHHLSAEALAELGRTQPAVALQMHRNMAVYLSGRLRSASSAWWTGVH